MLGILSLAITAGVTLFGFFQARHFVANRLRFVDAAQSGIAPIIAGIVAGLVAWPVAWLLPLIGGGTACLFGLAVGVGVSAGARDIRKRIGSGM